MKFRSLFLLMMVLLPLNAFAHDSWISRGALRNPAGEWCCGEGDCGVKVGGNITAVVGGFEVDADFQISTNPPTVDHVKEFIPYSKSQPSPDGAFWRCKKPDGSMRCFFAPPPGS